jgi:hypothetical protein
MARVLNRFGEYVDPDHPSLLPPSRATAPRLFRLLLALGLLTLPCLILYVSLVPGWLPQDFYLGGEREARLAAERRLEWETAARRLAEKQAEEQTEARKAAERQRAELAKEHRALKLTAASLEEQARRAAALEKEADEARRKWREAERLAASQKVELEAFRGKEIQGARYYPLKEGAAWVYRHNGGPPYTQRVAGQEKIGDQLCALIETVHDDGEVTFREHIGVTPDGVFRYTAKGKEINPPLCLLKLPVKKGETWEIKYRHGENVVKGTGSTGKEIASYKTAAGTFRVQSSTLDCVGSEDEAHVVVTTYFALDVGVVYQTIDLPDLKHFDRFELQKYTPGK